MVGVPLNDPLEDIVTPGGKVAVGSLQMKFPSPPPATSGGAATAVLTVLVLLLTTGGETGG